MRYFKKTSGLTNFYRLDAQFSHTGRPLNDNIFLPVSSPLVVTTHQPILISSVYGAKPATIGGLYNSLSSSKNCYIYLVRSKTVTCPR